MSNLDFTEFRENKISSPKTPIFIKKDNKINTLNILQSLEKRNSSSKDTGDSVFYSSKDLNTDSDSTNSLSNYKAGDTIPSLKTVSKQQNSHSSPKGLESSKVPKSKKDVNKKFFEKLKNKKELKLLHLDNLFEFKSSSKEEAKTEKDSTTQSSKKAKPGNNSFVESASDLKSYSFKHSNKSIENAKYTENSSKNSLKNFNRHFANQRSYSKLAEIQVISIGMASPDRIRQWAEKTLPNGKILGQVLNANTLHHKTFKPLKGGLFCERIFGPLKDFECSCGKSQKPKQPLNLSTFLPTPTELKKTESGDKSSDLTTPKESPAVVLAEQSTSHKSETAQIKKDPAKSSSRIFCPTCDVEYTWSVIRRYQLGYIELASPVTHIWYVKGNPSYMAILLDMTKRNLDNIIYCSEFLTLELCLKDALLAPTGITQDLNSFKASWNQIKNISVAQKDEFQQKYTKSDKKQHNLQKRVSFVNTLKSKQTKSKDMNTKHNIFSVKSYEKHIKKFLYLLNSIYVRNLKNKKAKTNLKGNFVQKVYHGPKENQSILLVSKKLPVPFYILSKNLLIIKANIKRKLILEASKKAWKLFSKKVYAKTLHKIDRLVRISKSWKLEESKSKHLKTIVALQKLQKIGSAQFMDVNFESFKQRKHFLTNKTLGRMNRLFSWVKKSFKMFLRQWLKTNKSIVNTSTQLVLARLKDVNINSKKIPTANLQSKFKNYITPKKISKSAPPFKTTCNKIWLMDSTKKPAYFKLQTKFQPSNITELFVRFFAKQKTKTVGSFDLQYSKKNNKYNLKHSSKGLAFGNTANMFQHVSDQLANLMVNSINRSCNEFENLGTSGKNGFLFEKTTNLSEKQLVLLNFLSNKLLKPLFLNRISQTLQTLRVGMCSKRLIEESTSVFSKKNFIVTSLGPKMQKLRGLTSLKKYDSGPFFSNSQQMKQSLRGDNQRIKCLKTKNLLSKSNILERKQFQFLLSAQQTLDANNLAKQGNAVNTKAVVQNEFTKTLSNKNETELKEEVSKQNWKKVWPTKIKNVYGLSSKYSWETEKDWQHFMRYYSAPFDFSDLNIPVYSTSFKDMFMFDEIKYKSLNRNLNAPTEGSFISKNFHVFNKATNISSLTSVDGVKNSNKDNTVSNPNNLPKPVLQKFSHYGQNPSTSTVSYSGAGMIQKLLFELDFYELKKMDKQNRILLYELRKGINKVKKRFFEKSAKKKLRNLCKKRDILNRRTKFVRKFFRKNPQPELMVLSVLPVLPPDLRPIVKMGDQIAASDLNRLYQRVIYRNERLKIFLKDPATSHSYEMKYAQRLLQEAVDNLIQNGKGRGAAEIDSRGRALKSLTDILKGKEGRFRQYLLGKRVDYSGRSVIVVGPKLKLQECGIPKEMALELYLPFLLKRILNLNLTRTVIGAKALIKTNKPLVWQLLREIMRDCPVLLNRAPTLHRLGFQAFQPKLVEGRAILLHPLVCPSFNADFDGDQMAVHVPITVEARAEAWKLMLSRNNLLSSATGEPIVLPSQDMVLGFYYLTTSCNQKSIVSQRGSSVCFSNFQDVLNAYYQQKIDVHAFVWVKWPGLVESPNDQEEPLEIRITSYGNWQEIYSKYHRTFNSDGVSTSQYICTTPGRILFNNLVKNLLV